MKKLYILLPALFFSLFCSAQQIGVSSIFNETRHYWNPAFTGASEKFTLQAFGRQQWVSFNGAPTTGFVGIEVPILYNNMAIGGFLSYDEEGPLKRTSIQANYAYNVRGLLARNSVLAIGVSASGTQLNFNPANETYNDEGDALISANTASTFFPSVNIGARFMNNTEEYEGTTFYVGFAYQQFFTTDVFVGNASLDRVRHIFGTVGLKLYGEYGFFEPSVNIAHVNPQLLDITVTGKYEFRDMFWIGAGYSSLSQASVQAGYILTNFSNGSLRLGASGNFNIGVLGENVGPGFEFIVGYAYDLE